MKANIKQKTIYWQLWTWGITRTSFIKGWDHYPSEIEILNAWQEYKLKWIGTAYFADLDKYHLYQPYQNHPHTFDVMVNDKQVNTVVLKAKHDKGYGEPTLIITKTQRSR